MNPVYPSALPVGRKSGRTYQLEDPMMRTQMGSGRARQRARFTDVPEYADIRWVFTDGQAQAFIAWWRDVLRNGTVWFEMPLRTTLGFGPRTCRFKAAYSGPTWIGNGLWSITAQLELQVRAAAPVGEGLYPDEIAYSEIFDLTINRELPNDHL